MTGQFPVCRICEEFIGPRDGNESGRHRPSCSRYASSSPTLPLSESEVELIRDFLGTLDSAMNHDWIKNRHDPYVAFADPDRDYIGGFGLDEGRPFVSLVRKLIGD